MSQKCREHCLHVLTIRLLIQICFLPLSCILQCRLLAVNSLQRNPKESKDCQVFLILEQLLCARAAKKAQENQRFPGAKTCYYYHRTTNPREGKAMSSTRIRDQKRYWIEEARPSVAGPVTARAILGEEWKQATTAALVHTLARQSQLNSSLRRAINALWRHGLENVESMYDMICQLLRGEPRRVRNFGRRSMACMIVLFEIDVDAIIRVAGKSPEHLSERADSSLGPQDISRVERKK
jgi:hypothetical protein